MKTEAEIRKAFEEHEELHRAMDADSEKLREFARSHHCTPEWARGFLAAECETYREILGRSR